MTKGQQKRQSISLKEFLISGQFGPVLIGDTKESILSKFVLPDDYNARSGNMKGATIWRYGYIEFHFHGNTLWMIYCDYLDRISAGKKISFDKWFLRKRKSQYLQDVVKILQANNIEYTQTVNSKLNQISIVIKESGVTLTCVNNEDVGSVAKNDFGKYILNAFHTAV